MADEKDLEKDAENTADVEDSTGSKDVQDGTEEAGGVPEGDESLEESQTEETQETEAATDDSKTASTGKKEKRFGKKKDKATQKLEEKIAGLEDQRVQMFETGAKSVVEKILPVIDNFERGLAGVPAEEKEAPFVQGVELVYKQLVTALEELGVKPIEAVGKEFDPAIHNAVMAVDDDTLESGTVAEDNNQRRKEVNYEQNYWY